VSRNVVTCPEERNALVMDNATQPKKKKSLTERRESLFALFARSDYKRVLLFSLSTS